MPKTVDRRFFLMGILLVLSAVSCNGREITFTPTSLPTATSRPVNTPVPPTQTASLVPTQTEPPLLGIGSRWTSPIDGMLMLYVPAGDFSMGTDVYDADDEKPAHVVHLSAFWIDQTEVTNAMYQLCVQAKVCVAPTSSASYSYSSYYGNPQFADYPIIFVSWVDARDYCSWAGKRLPSEAEWEKAARGDDGRTYPWGEDPPGPAMANYNNQVGDTRAVGSYPAGASPYGALDMAGNVAEWVADWYDPDYYPVSSASNPTGPESGEFRVLRGGSWFNMARAMRAAFRLSNYPDLQSDTLGFRCAR